MGLTWNKKKAANQRELNISGTWYEILEIVTGGRPWGKTDVLQRHVNEFIQDYGPGSEEWDSEWSDANEYKFDNMKQNFTVVSGRLREKSTGEVVRVIGTWFQSDMVQLEILGYPSDYVMFYMDDIDESLISFK